MLPTPTICKLTILTHIKNERKNMTSRPDFSHFLVHFTKNKQPVGAQDPDNPIRDKAKGMALTRLISILTDKKIIASTMPWTNCHCVCLTECPWASLIDHTKSYSPYGIGFSKQFVFSRNGSPVYYVRADQYEKQEWNEHLKSFVTPFWPRYRPKSIKEKKDFRTCDYTHEREWRVPHDFPFDYDQIEFIILDKYEDMAKFPKELKDSIGRINFYLWIIIK
ncbi:abortive infection system antitoxin AbiGi family protein [Porphyromonas macacae]|uniref:abortive infection system antitoxin AbiGi family protein n=1 Tax=Porphyromonas macacae TaxID=28115 RepID=UPI001F59295A|nr:abortive infection system antitoxin AbiGi family protein [Porphyromonas macacae]